EIWGNGTTNSDSEEVRRKSEVVGKALVRWNWTKFGHVQHRIKSMKEELALILASNNLNGSPDREESLSKELEELLVREELLWNQRAKAD
ncbi:hypothetical protein U1Q18_036628, partial [Sarracenia purpurea var. burkii]